MNGVKRMSDETVFRSIGLIRTPYTDDAPYQPVEEEGGEFRIELEPSLSEGLKKLESFRYIYVLYYVDRVSRDVETLVKPPWAGGYEVGLFASRSPVRPNRIGLSVVKLKKIEGNVIYTSPLDCFDGTPLLDIKPYIAELDSKSDANYGWVDELEDRDHLILHIKGIPHDY